MTSNVPANPIARFFPFSDTMSTCEEHVIVVYPMASTPFFPIIGTCVTSQGGLAMHNICICSAATFANGLPPPVAAPPVAAPPIAAPPVSAAIPHPPVAPPAAKGKKVLAGVVKKPLTLY